MIPALRAFQDRLAALGLYSGVGDGDWGPKTETAIDLALKALEKGRGITPPLYPKLPAAYQWVAQLAGLPLTIHEAFKLLGTLELKGAPSSPTILAWRDELNAAGIKVEGYVNDGVPWCGLFAAIVAHRAGKEVVQNPLWAANWAKFGQADEHPRLGDIVTYSRTGGNHVAWWLARDLDGFDHVVGGNQSDSVSIMRIAASRRTSARIPIYHDVPASVKDYVVAATGAISHNEA